jgi:dTDP-4-amino-4,6-dideoxygalactose transaminase
MVPADQMTTSRRIPFTRVPLLGNELEYVRQAAESGQIAGDGPFTRRCERMLESLTGSPRALLTHSGTAALEMAALLADVGAGDEVILPSFTFTSTANAFVLRGATPVFVDIERSTFNVDPAAVERAITSRTRVIVPVHYAGNACDMDRLSRIASDAEAMVIEDAAQALLSTHRNHPLGSFGAMAALSFHQTKNITSGEGGALLINDPRLIERAEILREKGTDRARFFRGEIDRYTWVDIGSSYLPGELIAAFLCAQLEKASETTERRRAIWRRYQDALESLELEGFLTRPAPLHDGGGNAHLYAILLRSLEHRTEVIEELKRRGISAVFHYVPLHDSPAGRRFGRTPEPLPVTDDISARLLRLPLWDGMRDEDVDFVVGALQAAVAPMRHA